MVVKEVQTAREQFTVTGEGYAPLGHFYDRQGERLAVETHADLRFLLLSALLCNDAHLYQAAEDWTIIGDPTEGALLALAGKGGLTSTALGQIFVRQGEIPFSSERKQMSVMISYQPSTPISIWAELLAESPYFLLTKGSPETLLPRCSSGLINGKIQPLDPTGQEKILSENNHLAGRGLRVLGFAYKPLKQILNVGGELIQKYSSSDFVWLGFVGMLDAPRPEVKAAVAKCQGAGIRTIMITGDHPLTAAVIAQELGISTQNEAVMTGQQLDQLSQSQLEAEVERIGVFARVSPEHKLRIVQALQKCQKFVAMTGDGVNDAPALKQADIGIAMGITGTDVSKEASDMVLLDDNFATIVAATEEGRVVYSNTGRTHLIRVKP
jgi:Ca2+-transporting ATPase